MRPTQRVIVSDSIRSDHLYQPLEARLIAKRKAERRRRIVNLIIDVSVLVIGTLAVVAAVILFGVI